MLNTNINQRLINKPRPSDNLIMPKVKFKGSPLGDKQVKILELIGEGHSNAEISTLLEISDRSVDSYIYDIRNLISKELGYRLGERQLVLFAKDMLDGYVAYVRLLAEQEIFDFTIGKQVIRLGTTDLIEDWDDYDIEEEDEEEDDDNEEDLDSLYPRPRSGLNKQEEFDIADFKIEKIAVQKQANKFLLL